MVLQTDETPQNVNPPEAEYFELDSAESPVVIRMHLEALDGISRDVVEGFTALPSRGAEVGGLLLGVVERRNAGEKPIVSVERYQRVGCQHSLGPGFILDSRDVAGLEEAAREVFDGGRLAVVGLYRSHTRPGFQLEDSDREMIARYFSDASDIILLIKPETVSELSAQFFARENSAAGMPGEVRPVSPVFPFRGRALSLSTTDGNAPPPAPAAPTRQDSLAAPAQARPRRLIPDFVPEAVEPARPRTEDLPESEPTSRHRASEPAPGSMVDRFKHWWPLPAAALVVGGLLWALLNPGTRQPPPTTAAAEKNVSVRPLGLYVDPVGDTWRVSWNPNATALHDARSVQLFVRQGDDQNRIELSPHDLSTGTYQYRQTASDVTFRLEVMENSRRITAESFRFTHASPAAPVVPEPKAPATVAPRAIHRVPPQVPASIRPRIKGSIPLDVRVKVDARGRVVSATPAGKIQAGLETYLAARAVAAAKLWRFEPAREGGKAVPGEQTIHFKFEK